MSYMEEVWQGIKGIEYNMFHVTTGIELDIYIHMYSIVYIYPIII